MNGFITDVKACYSGAPYEERQSYALYLPAQYARERTWPILYCLDPDARGRIPVRVKAPDLAGVVEYYSMHFSGVCVEEYADDWVTQLSQVKTDDDGRFALPETRTFSTTG